MLRLIELAGDDERGSESQSSDNESNHGSILLLSGVVWVIERCVIGNNRQTLLRSCPTLIDGIYVMRPSKPGESHEIIQYL